MSHSVCLVKGEPDGRAKKKEEINLESTLQVTFIWFSLIHQSSVIWLSSLGLVWKGGIYCTVSQGSDLQSGGHGLYPRREQGTRKRGGEACESLCRGVNTLYITNSFPATLGGISGGHQPALCPPLVPRSHTRNRDQQVGNKLTPWLPVHFFLLGETFG